MDSHTLPGQRQSAHFDFDGSKVYACLGVACHLHFRQNDWGLLRATAVTRGWNGHHHRSILINMLLYLYAGICDFIAPALHLLMILQI